MGALVLAIMVFALVSGLASADNNTNDAISTAEKIGTGTHTGTVSISDYNDYYKVEDIGDREVRVYAKIIDPGMDDHVTVTSVNMADMSDNQINIFLSPGFESDDCHWKDEGGGDTMYLQVQGMGDYEIRIEMDDGGDEKWSLPIFCWFVGGAIVAAGIIVLGLIGALYLGLFEWAKKAK